MQRTRTTVREDRSVFKRCQSNQRQTLCLPGPLRRAVQVALALCAGWLIAACGGDRDRSTGSKSVLIQCARNVEALERAKAVPKGCGAHADCPAGSHCDARYVSTSLRQVSGEITGADHRSRPAG